jgi:hypothetical protein
VPGEPLPSYRDDELEALAVHFLQGRFGSDVPIPVDIEWLVETLPDVDFDGYPALRANYGLDAGVWRDPTSGKLLVAVDEEVMDDDSAKGIARYRSTVAEQLSHVLLHPAAIEKLDGPDAFSRFQTQVLGAGAGRAARRLAQALLMPTEGVREEARRVYRQLVQLVGTGNPVAVKKFLCARLAKQFRVSEAAMGHRLQNAPLRLGDQIDDALRRGLSGLS